jgi:hypothetical protein
MATNTDKSKISKIGDFFIVLSAALLGLLVNDHMKLRAQQMIDPFKAAPNLEDSDNTASDLPPRISAQASDLSEENEDEGESTVKNWRQAEREVRHISPSLIPMPRDSAEAETNDAIGSESCIT